MKWKTDGEYLTAELGEYGVYEIELEEYLDNEADWLEHLSKKRWFDADSKREFHKMVFGLKNKKVK